jgi:hypothetical protein
MVASNVYLSTAAAAKTGIGTITPQTKLEVNGDAQFGSGVNKSTFTSAGALQLASPLGLAYGGAGASLTGVATGGIIYKNAATTLTGAALTGVLKGNGAGAPTDMNGTAGYNTYWSDANTIAAEQYTALARGGSNADLSAASQGGIVYKGASSLAVSAALTGVLKGNGTGAPTAMNGAAGAIAYWSDANTIDNSTILSHSGTRLLVSGAADFTGSVTSASSATFKASGLNQYSIVTSSGILISEGRLVMPEGAVNNYIMATNAAGVTRWVNPASGGFGDGWVGNEVVGATDGTLTRSGNGLYGGSDYTLGLNLNNANTWTQTQSFNRGVSVSTITVTSFGSAGFVRNTAAGILSGGNGITLGTDTDGNYAGSASEGGAASDVACSNCISLNSEVNNTLPVGNGGTGATTLTGVLKGNGTAAFTASNVNLTSEVTGILPAANGGTNNGFTQFSGPAGAAKTFTLPNVSATILTDNTNVTVAQGGTGVASLTSNAVLLGGATVGSVSVSANNVLLGNAGAPTSGKVTSSYTTGVSDSFVVYSSTGAAGQCRTLTITNGMLTAITAAGACPAP